MSKSVFRVGTLHDPKNDIYPSSGTHLDFRVKDEKGNWLNPLFARSFIGNNIRVGEKNLPLYVNQNGQWNLNPEIGATITSGFGPRSTGIPGASRDHKGVDVSGGLLSKPGTPISWGGTISDSKKIDESNKTIWTTDPNTGKKYQVSFLHVKPSDVAFQPTTQTTNTQTPTINPNQTLSGLNQVFEFNVGNASGKETKEEKKPDFISSITESLMGNLIAQAFGEQKDPYNINGLLDIG